MRKAIVYGYARISTMKQSLQRQIDNIRQKYPDAIVVSEAYTGTEIDRPAFSKLLPKVQPGDTIVFDEVSRMSRNAAEGFSLYRDLYEKGVNLVFIKEPHVNTDVYKSALEKHIDLTVDTGRKAIDRYIDGQGKLLNDLLLDLAKEQIEIAFEAAQSEVEYTHRRTKEGVQTAKQRWLEEEAAGKPHLKGKPGRMKGQKVKEYAKAKAAKEVIRKHCKDFGGTLSDAETMKIAGCARGSYYKYKRQIKEETGA